MENEKYAEIVRGFGLSPTASKVYVSLLDSGKSSADSIAKKVGTYKANVYDALDRLADAGLVSHIVEGKKKLYLPANPEKLMAAAEEARNSELARFEELKRNLQEVMPQLSAKYESVKEKERFEIYVGRKAYKSVISEVSRSKAGEWKGFGNLQVLENFPVEFPKWFRGVKIRLFSTKSDKVEKLWREAKKHADVELKWLPQELAMPVVWTIFGENLLILIYEPEIVVLRIRSPQIIRTFSAQFEYFWKRNHL